MATRQMNTIIQNLRRVALAQDRANMTDGQLLEAFIAQKEDESFDALLRRHGPMVMGVCRRVVRNHHDAEDAFQATFLVLARKASSVRPREQVANWLHGVAYRTAVKARAMRFKTQVREKQVAQMPESEASPQDQWHDLQPIIDQELSGLPENYRLPIILCDLEGKSIKEATQQLGWPQGTLAGRLVRARKMLAKRLTQRGVVLSGGALAVVLGEKAASACVPLSLAITTTKAAVAVAAGQAVAPSLVSAKVAALMEGVMKGMMLTKLKTVMAMLLVLGVLAFGGSMATQHTATAQQISAEEGNQQAIKKAKNPPTSLEVTRLNDDATAQTIKDSPKTLDEQKLHGEWIDNENGKISLIFGPEKTVRLIKENGFAGYGPYKEYKGTYSVDWNKNPHHLDLKLISTEPAMQTIMEFVEPGKLRIESGGGDEARPKAFTDETIVLTKREKHSPESQQADRDIKVAEFYRRTGKFGTAHFYYQLVQNRYPGTVFAEKAKQGLEDLKKHRSRLPDGSEVWESPAQPGRRQPPPMIQNAPPVDRDVHELRQQVKALENRLTALEDKGKPQPPAKTGRNAPAYGQEMHELRQQVKNLESRLAAIEAKKELPKVGRIIVVGNTKLDSVIRKEMQLLPGQPLDDKALRAAEKSLAAFDATIEVIDTNDPGFKDILVRVKKK